MAFKFKQADERGTWSEQPIRFTDMESIDVTGVKNAVENWCREQGIPIIISEAEYVSGSMFSKTSVPLILIRHPDPLCKYFTLGLYAHKNVLYFPLFGESAENTKANKHEMYKNQGSIIKAKFYEPDMFKLQEEIDWQLAVYAFFEGFLV